jgi:UDP-N-acetylmuramate--alanine ligase
MDGPCRTCHFIGIGGVMLSALAGIMHQFGWRVSGSDRQASLAISRLEQAGIRCSIGHHSANTPGDCDLIVASAAIADDNEELVAARNRGIEVWSKGDLLRLLMADRCSVGVAGTHGKTTTTAMIGLALLEACLDPVILVGGDVSYLGGNYRAGRGPHLVAETDESDGSFLKLRPDVAVVTNIDSDHLDYWGDFDGVLRGFQAFLTSIKPDGIAVLMADDQRLMQVAAAAGVAAVTFGLGVAADLQAADVKLGVHSSSFRLAWRGRDLGTVSLGVPGRHNVANALGAICAALRLGAQVEPVLAAMSKFRGVRRRLELKGASQGVAVIDDYGHHPTEVRATLETIRPSSAGRLICVFQPHRYSRTQRNYYEFGESFDLADELILLDIYSAGEAPVPGVDSSLIERALSERGHGPPTRRQEGPHEAVVELLADYVMPGDTVLTLGAGDVYRIGDRLLARLATPDPEAGQSELESR